MIFSLELAVADSFFSGRRSSSIAIATIMNSLEKYALPLPPALSSAISICPEDDEILEVRQRLRLLLTENGR